MQALFRTNRRSDERGQVLVLAAIMLTVLLAMASVAVDMGRFVGERRFLQNAADAATLAASFALSQGRSPAEAEFAAGLTLTQHFAKEPTGNPPSQPSATPVYDSACGTTPNCLIEGILINGADVRVALRNDVNFTFAQVVGMNDQTIAARAHAGPDPGGAALPIAARQFLHPPGPQTAPQAGCPYDDTQFMAVFATADTSCLGSASNPAWTPPSSTPGQEGPTVEILGQGADPSVGPSFRGFVALDIRDFANAYSRDFYNGVTPTTSPNALKTQQAGYIRTGYPGPPFPPRSLPHPDWQIATMDGNSAGIPVAIFWERFTVGDKVIVLVYDGIVKQIPEFYLNWPNTNSLGEIAAPTTGALSGTYRVSSNQAFTDNVTLSTLTDPNDPDNPMNTDPPQIGPFSQSPSNPVTPSQGQGTQVTISSTTTAAAPGIYALLIRGQSTQYEFAVKYLPASLNVGGVLRDFALGSPQANGTESAGTPVTFTIPVANTSNNPDRRFSGLVDLTLEGLDGTVLQTIATGVAPGQNVSRDVTISTTGLSTGAYNYFVRGTGLNGEAVPRKVTHLLPLTVFVGQRTPGDDTYVDVTGFALMEVMGQVGSRCMPSNSVCARALTPVLDRWDHPDLAPAKQTRLIPWDYSP